MKWTEVLKAPVVVAGLVVGAVLFAISLTIVAIGWDQKADSNAVKVLVAALGLAGAAFSFLFTLTWTRVFGKLGDLEKSMPTSFEGLGPVARAIFIDRYRKIGSLVDRLRHQSSFEVDEYEMYTTLIGMTESLPPGFGEIWAVSSIGVADFAEPFGSSYVEANKQAQARGVKVRRLFLIRSQYIQADKREVTFQALRVNADKLGSDNVGCHKFEDVISTALDYNDFALFGEQVLFKQTLVAETNGVITRTMETIVAPDKVKKAASIFQELWSSVPSPMTVEKFIGTLEGGNAS